MYENIRNIKVIFEELIRDISSTLYLILLRTTKVNDYKSDVNCKYEAVVHNSYMQYDEKFCYYNCNKELSIKIVCLFGVRIF